MVFIPNIVSKTLTGSITYIHVTGIFIILQAVPSHHALCNMARNVIESNGTLCYIDSITYNQFLPHLDNSRLCIDYPAESCKITVCKLVSDSLTLPNARF